MPVTEAVRAPEVVALVSAVSAFPEVRRVVGDRQREWVSRRGGRAVVEGRDIGTVVFPGAQVKVFLDASPTVRADRRVLEMRQKGMDADPVQVANEIRERDQRDMSRTEAPLAQAADATYVDTSSMTQEEVIQALLRIVRLKTGKEMEK